MFVYNWNGNLFDHVRLRKTIEINQLWKLLSALLVIASILTIIRQNLDRFTKYKYCPSIDQRHILKRIYINVSHLSTLWF